MEVITTYKAVDGKTFETEQECRVHEAAIFAMENGLDKFLGSRNLSDPEQTLVRSAIIDWEARKRSPASSKSSLDVLELSTRTLTCLREGRIETIEDLVNSTENALMRIPGMGRRSINEIKEILEMRGLALRG
jgi:DNA-directed RNA polymerase alpha subunit